MLLHRIVKSVSVETKASGSTQFGSFHFGKGAAGAGGNGPEGATSVGVGQRQGRADRRNTTSGNLVGDRSGRAPAVGPLGAAGPLRAVKEEQCQDPQEQRNQQQEEQPRPDAAPFAVIEKDALAGGLDLDDVRSAVARATAPVP